MRDRLAPVCLFNATLDSSYKPCAIIKPKSNRRLDDLFCLLAGI